jgi:hypothetical protein
MIRSLTLREGHDLRVLKTIILRRIFGLKREEVAGIEKIIQLGASTCNFHHIFCLFNDALCSSDYTGLFKKKYTLSKIYFASTIEHMATCYI